ncbi:hypothetical protein PENSPDRAFT_603102 [Peniophora sp. CONT]|nr:hypothetical protein PENSPDRAFT_603102 [Peniophora sp. CONT]
MLSNTLRAQSRCRARSNRLAPLLRTVTSSAKPVYVLPIDPSAPKSATGAPVDAAQLWQSAPTGKKPAKAGTSRLFYGENNAAVVSLGEGFDGKKGVERREVVRKAVGSAIKAVKGLGDEELKVVVDASADAHASAVAAHLARYKFGLKTDPPSSFRPGATETPAENLTFEPLEAFKEWDEGRLYAEAQNFARTLQEMPANMMTPTAFCERAQAEFASIPGVTVVVRDEEWAKEKGMNLFLSVSRGTDEPAKFLEIHYNGASQEDQPVAFVGKGITFDTGGISIKPSANMKLMRGDMGGAATVVAATLAIAKLKLPVNLITVCPLSENMPGPSATKPGDIVYAMNGKSVEIDNTDAEGRLVLADALTYATTEFKPHTVIDAATLTGAIVVALGEVYTGTYTNSDGLWDELRTAGEIEYDRFWRMPLDQEYLQQITATNADLMNAGSRAAGSVTAAMFLKHFVEGVEGKDDAEPSVRWAHLDIAGTMESSTGSPYQEKGMTGRPVRALIEWAKRLGQ